MPGLAAVVTVLFATAGSLFMAWTIGAGSSGSTPFAPAVGANAISVMRAGFVVGVLGFAGAVLQGQNVSETVGSGLIRGVTISPTAVVVGLFTAAFFVAIGIFTGYPIATAFTVTGAMTGVGLALGGAPAWGTYRQIVALWALIPFVGGGAAYALAQVLSDQRVPTRAVIAVLAGLTALLVVNMRFSILGSSGDSQSLATVIAVTVTTTDGGISAGRIATSFLVAAMGTVILGRRHSRGAAHTERWFLLGLGGLVAFSAGGTQVGLAVGPLLPLLDGWEIPPVTVLLFGGVGLLVGSWTGAPRMIKAISQDYSALGPKRSIAALVPSFFIAQTAVIFGVPVSFNEIIVSAILGAGLASDGDATSLSKMRYTVIAWLGSLFLSGLCSYAAISLWRIL